MSVSRGRQSTEEAHLAVIQHPAGKRIMKKKALNKESHSRQRRQRGSAGREAEQEEKQALQTTPLAR